MNKVTTKKNKSQGPDKKPIQPTLSKMEKYETQLFPLNRADSVKVSANTINIKKGYEFTTKTKREDKTISVTRIS